MKFPDIEGIPFNFMGIPKELSDAAAAKAAVLPAPYDHTTSFGGGSREGPTAIILASMQVEWYDEELGIEPCRAGICTLPFLEPDVSGPEAMICKVENAVEAVIKAGKFPILLGGEHSISLGPVRSLATHYRNLSVLVFDAHADLRNSYQNSPYSHACFSRRAQEICPVVQAGIRSLSQQEAKDLPQLNVRSFFAREIHSGLDMKNELLKLLKDQVYISVDLDVFDPSVLPAVGTPEPGGLSWHQALEIMEFVFKNRDVVGFDIMELAPLPGMRGPDFIAAKLAYRMIGYKFADQLKQTS